MKEEVEEVEEIAKIEGQYTYFRPCDRDADGARK
jgi:hypothetical protein